MDRSSNVTLVNTKGPSKKEKGRPERLHILVATKGKEIARVIPDIQTEMIWSVVRTKETEVVSTASREFAEDPCSSVKRSNMMESELMKAYKGFRKNTVELILRAAKDEAMESELMKAFKGFRKNNVEFIQQAAKSKAKLKDPRLRDDLAVAIAVLKNSSTKIFLNASKVYIRHPELSAAKENRDYIFLQVCEAVNTIGDVAQGKSTSGAFGQPPYDGPGELAAALDEFDERIDPQMYNEERSARPASEELLESIISGATLMADSLCIWEELRERIVAECNAVRQALQDLLSEYRANTGRKDISDPTDIYIWTYLAVDHITRKTKNLRRELCMAVVYHILDTFTITDEPLFDLIEAAEKRNEVEQHSQVFTEHANKYVEVGNLACSMSNNKDGINMVRFAAFQIRNLCPQVINAARVLAARPCSEVAQENMDAFKEAWKNTADILTDAVVDIISRLIMEHSLEDFAGIELDEYPEISGINNARDFYRLISEEGKQKIAAEVENIHTVKSRFDWEVAKWDDTGNDYIMVAKQMCMIMMEMTDFTRGKGPLKTKKDVINAARKISEYSTKLVKLTRLIAYQCPESYTKTDLLMYLEWIALYCYELNITCKVVKADVQNISGSLIVSGVDSAFCY